MPCFPRTTCYHRAWKKIPLKQFSRQTVTDSTKITELICAHQMQHTKNVLMSAFNKINFRAEVIRYEIINTFQELHIRLLS